MSSFQSRLVRFFLRRSNMWNKPLGEIRKMMEGIKARGIPGNIEVSEEKLNGVDCEVFIPHIKNNKVIIYFHGGGYCMGIYNANREFVAGLAQKIGSVIYMPNYRLAPENPFPAALEDAIVVYKGILNKCRSEEEIIIMGDSSGCGLALSALLVLKQSNEKMPAAMAFITPVFDFTGKGETFTTKAGKDPFKMNDPLGVAKIYIGDNNPTSPLLSPLYGDLEGLPPMLIHAAEYDVFLSDSCRLADKAKAAGVNVDIRIWRKMWHIFHMQTPFVPESRKAFEDLCLFVK